MAFDPTGLPTQWDYDGDQGDTLRFGFEGFGQPPNDGDVYDVTYRIGVGATGNVAPRRSIPSTPQRRRTSPPFAIPSS